MPKEAPLSLDKVTQLATETLLKDGFHQPTVIAQGNRDRAVVGITSIASTADERAQQMFTLGMLLAEEGKLGVLQQAFFITEAWLSLLNNGRAPHVRPSQDPQRKEVLTVSRLNVLPRQLETVVYEMKRDSSGDLIRLDEIAELPNTKNASAESPLLDALVIGFFGLHALPDD